MANNLDLMEEALRNFETGEAHVRRVSPAARAPEERELPVGERPRRRAIYEREPLRTLVGTGQEMVVFFIGIPRMLGADIRAPRVVETGLPEKLGAGVLEYLTGAGALKAIPAIQRGVQLARQIPAIGRAIAAPITQRAAGAAALGAVGEPERPLRGAAMGAAISPAVEAGFKVPSKAVDFMTKSKWSPFHNAMMPHIRREFNELLQNTGNRLGLTTEHDVDKALFDTLSDQYETVSGEAKTLYDEANKAFKTIKSIPISPKAPINWKIYLGNKVSPMIKNIMKDYEKATDLQGVQLMSSMEKLERNIKNPVKFRRQLHASERDAFKTGNFDLLQNLEKIEKNFNKSIETLTIRIKDANVSNAFNLLKKADEYFKENVVPFRKRARVKLEEGKTKMIPTEFFKAHSNDISRDLTKKINRNIQDLEHTSKNMPITRDYLTFGHLKEGMDKPEQFIKNYKKLTKEQKAHLFPKDQIDRLNKFIKIYEKNPAAFREEELKTKFFSPMTAAMAGGLASIMHPIHTHIPLTHYAMPPVLLGGLAGGLGALGARAGIRGLAKIPPVRETYIAGRPTAALPAGIREAVIGALLGTTRE